MDETNHRSKKWIITEHRVTVVQFNSPAGEVDARVSAFERTAQVVSDTTTCTAEMVVEP